MSHPDRPLVWLHGEIKTPPFSAAARIEAGVLLRRLQRGETLPMPHTPPMPVIGPHCHELRINDTDGTWRIIYRLDHDAVMALIITPASFLGARASGPRAGGTPALPGRAPGGIMIEAATGLDRNPGRRRARRT